jgi:hypothetical protein
VAASTWVQYRRLALLIKQAGQPARFSIPASAPAAAHLALHAITFAAWLDREGLSDPHLRWYLDYAAATTTGRAWRRFRPGPASTSSPAPMAFRRPARRLPTTNPFSPGPRATAGSLGVWRRAWASDCAWAGWSRASPLAGVASKSMPGTRRPKPSSAGTAIAASWCCRVRCGSRDRTPARGPAKAGRAHPLRTLGGGESAFAPAGHRAVTGI